MAILELSTDTYAAVAFRVGAASELISVDGLDQLEYGAVDDDGEGFDAGIGTDDNVTITVEVADGSIVADDWRGDSINATLDGADYSFEQNHQTPDWPPDSWFTEQEERLTNEPPVADAGTSQTVVEGNVVTLDASGSSDPNSDSLTYSWSQTSGDDVSLNDANDVTATFTAPEVSSNTSLTFEVLVADPYYQDTDTVSVTVQNQAENIAEGTYGEGGFGTSEYGTDSEDTTDPIESGYGSGGYGEGRYGDVEPSAGEEVDQSILWETAADWDVAQSSTGVHHEQPSNTDWATSNVVEKGYYSDIYGADVYLPLDEDNTTTVTDVTGNGNNGTSQNVTIGVDGILGTSAYEFSGSVDSRADIPHNTDLDADGAVTVNAWVNAADGTTPTTGDSQIVGKNRGSDVQYGILWEETTEQVVFRITNSNGATAEVKTPLSWGPTDGFTHFAGKYDGSSMAIYRDGDEVASSTVSLSVDESSGDISIGANPNAAAGEQHFTGVVDEVVIWSDRAITDSRLNTMYNAVATVSTIYTPKYAAYGYDPDISVSSTVPENTTIEVTFFEDVGGDGVGSFNDGIGNAYNNSHTMSLDGGIDNLSLVDTFEDNTDGIEDDYWCRVRLINDGGVTTASPELNSIDIQFNDQPRVTEIDSPISYTSGRNISTANAEWDSPIRFTEGSNMKSLVEALLSAAEDVDSRLEEVYASHHIDYSTGDDLDRIGEFVGIQRQTDESDSRYRTRIKAAFRSATIGTTTDEFIEFVASTVGTNARNITIEEATDISGPVVRIVADQSVWGEVELDVGELSDIFDDGVPAGHSVVIQESGTFLLISDGATNTPENGLTADDIETGGTLASDIV